MTEWIENIDKVGICVVKYAIEIGKANINNHLKVAVIYMVFQMRAQSSLSSLSFICFTPNDLTPLYCSWHWYKADPAGLDVELQNRSELDPTIILN